MTRTFDLSQHYLLDTGAVMRGPFTLQGSPTSDLMAATRAYVDTKAAQGGNPTGFPEAPIDGQFYGRKGQTSQWLPVAPLGADGKVPSIYLPPVAGQLVYKAGWTVTTNTPALANGGLVGGQPSTAGDYYVSLVSGTASPAIDGITTVNAGDWLISTGAAWQRQQNSAGIYLPLTGGTATGNITAPSVTVVTDTWTGAGLAADLAYSWRDANGNVPIAVTFDGSLLVAAVYPPFTATMPTSKGYTDTTFLPILNATAQGSFTVPGASTFGSPLSVDVAFGVQDATGQIPFMVDASGNTWIASLRTFTPPNYVAATIGVLTYDDLSARTLTQASDWLNGYTYDWTISDGTHIAAALTHEGRLRTRLALETQSLDLSTSTGLGNAYQLDPCVANILTCGPGGGVQLKRARGGVWYVFNSHTQAISVWPMAGAQLGMSAIGAPIGVEPGAAVICWQVSLTKYGVEQAGAGGGGSMVYTATGATNPRDARDRAADTINVNDLVAGIDPSGVADNSIQIKAAHDLAASLGYRYMRFPARSKINAPFGGAINAPLIANVIFTGEKCTINTYKKVIADPDGKSFVWPSDDLTPPTMAVFTAAVNAATAGAPAHCLVIGHSGVDANGRAGPGGNLVGVLMQKLAREYGNKPIRISDRSIGGTAWIDMARNGPPLNSYGNDAGNPVWWAQRRQTTNGDGYTRRWIEYMLELQPVHCLFISHGANDNQNFDVYAMEAFLAEVRSRFSPVPNIFMIADYGRQLMSTFTGGYALQETMDYCAGYQRTWCRRNGVGFFDFGRGQAILRDGYDPVGGRLMNFIDGFPEENNNQLTTTFPYTYPATQSTTNFSVRFGPAGNANTFFQGRKWIAQIGADVGNILILDQDASGFLAYTVQSIAVSNTLKYGRDPTWPAPSGPYISVPRTVTTFDMNQANGFTIELDFRDAEMFMQFSAKNGATFTQDVVTIRRRVDRYGGFFLPTFYWDNASTSTVTVLQAAKYVPDTYVPQLTDFEWLDYTLHVNPYGQSRLWKPIIDAARFT